jgi:hypothetical protein
MPDVPEQHASAKDVKSYLGREQLRRVHRPKVAAATTESKHIKLHQMEYMLAAARYSNFGKAAAEFEVSPSALGQAIAELEQNLGVKLFERDQNGARITPEGEALLEHAERLLAAEDAARIAVAKVSGQDGPRRHSSGPEAYQGPIVVNVEAIRQFRSDVAASVRVAVEFIEEYAAEQDKPAVFLMSAFEDLKRALPEIQVSGETVERMAAILDTMQASINDDEGRGATLLETVERASERFRERHAAAVEGFSQRSVRLETAERPGTHRPESPRAR